MNEQVDKHRIANIIRRIARMGSVASIGLLLMFLLGGQEQLPRLSAESIGLLFFPLGIMLGMAIGWRSPRWGGWLTAFSLLAFYVWHWLHAGRIPGGPYFVIFAAPGLLFLASSFWNAPRA